jgi:TetR/AcrR family transcriptional regulator, multidrug resistance operon repressor
VVNQMLQALLQADREEMTYQERFFNFFVSHCLFYIEHPNALFFMEQFVNSPYNSRQGTQENERAQATFKDLIKYGVDHRLLQPLDHRVISSLVHGAVVSTAKIHLCRKIALGPDQLQQIAAMIWAGMKNPAAS